MKFILQPWQLMLIFLVSCVNRERQQRIDYLETQCDVVRERIGKKQNLLTDDQRRRVAVKGKLLGRKQLEKVETRFTPDTILRWHRQLGANRWDYSDRREKRPGRPTVRQASVDLTVKFAKENPTRGFDRIRGALSNVGYNICESTIGNILKAHGIEPAPTRRRTGSWETFLKAHWEEIASIDFTTVKIWTKSGLTTFRLLFVVELKNRRVHFAGCTTNPNDAWMKTIAREFTNYEDGFLNDKNYLIMDRDTTFSQSFRACLRREGVKQVRFSPQRPNLNAHLERIFGSLKSECLHKLILFGQNAMRKAVRAFVTHYHTQRNHQGLDHELIVPMDRPPDIHAAIATTEHLGGLLRSYRHAAWLIRPSLAPRHSGLKTAGVMSAARCRRFRSLFSQRRTGCTRSRPRIGLHRPTHLRVHSRNARSELLNSDASAGQDIGSM